MNSAVRQIVLVGMGILANGFLFQLVTGTGMKDEPTIWGWVFGCLPGLLFALYINNLIEIQIAGIKLQCEKEIERIRSGEKRVSSFN